jgi:solute carrier family 13 (sodium-dependent dicarboxylate transporter), member 2/3/5
MSTPAARPRVSLPRSTLVQRLGLLLGSIAFVVPLLVEIPGLEPAGHRMLAIFMLAILLWVTEAIPSMPRRCW